MGAKERWLSRVAETTAQSYENRLGVFMVWLKENGGKFSDMSPDDLVEYQSNTDNGSKYDLLDLVQQWAQGLDLRYSTKKTDYRRILSFFRHNRAELPDDPSFKIRSDKPPVKITLTLQDVRDVILSSNRTYRSIFIAMFQGGMDLSAFEYWNENGWEDMKKQLRDDPEVIRIELPGRKKRRNKEAFYTFIGMDAIDALRDYLGERIDEKKFAILEEKRKEWCRKHNQKWEPKEYIPGCIFYNQQGKPIKKGSVHTYWLKHLQKIGKVKTAVNGDASTRYGKNIHELRDLFRTQWEKSPAKGSVAEFAMGHAIDPLEYNKACKDEAWTSREYKKALPLLQIMSSTRPFGQVDEEELIILQRQIRKLEQENKDRVRLDTSKLKDELLKELRKELGIP